MIGKLKFLVDIRLFSLLFSIIGQSQLYDNSLNTELSSHFFGLNYFPASWQSSIFEEDIYSVASLQEKVEFNKLSNSLRLNYSGAEKMLYQFKDDYPNNIVSKNIDLDVANYYFNNEKYRYALKWYNRISENEVSKLDKPMYNFNKGYTLFSAKNYKKALPYLEKVKDNKNYESDAYYYLGHIAYQLEDYDGALSSFKNISDTTQKDDLSYFQADMNFRLGRFNQAIELAQKAIIDSNKNEKSELSKIIGESYFNLVSYSESIPYLEGYKGKRGKWKNDDYYQLGYAYFKEKKFEKAIGQFNKIIGEKNALAQSAYYALAECYLETNLKASALNAFKSASAMSFNSQIKEDAFLNYAKLSYEIGNPFEDPPKVLVDFLEAYPKNEQQELIKELLINSYTKSGNYTAALEILENKNGYKNNGNLKRVLILSAIQQYQSGFFSKASTLFKRGLKIKENKSLEAYALYWFARSEYERNLFDNALDLFKQFRKHPKKNEINGAYVLNYDIGYVYFKLGEYEYALKSFEAFNESNSQLDISLQRDTFLRMGDCQFALKKYWPAMENYNIAIAINPKLGAYATFQKGLCYGFVERNTNKIKTLNKFLKIYPEDALIDDVLFQLASAYSQEQSYEMAIITYETLLNRFNNSPYLGKASLNKGLILYNQEKYEVAKTILENVALTYKNYAIGEQAIRTLKEIAVDQGKVAAFGKWIKINKLGTFNNFELEKTAFSSAERQLIQGNNNSALRLFEEYLETYPIGLFSKEATFYLADLYYGKEIFNKALVAYQSLVKDQISVYTEKALTRIITIMKNNDQQKEAVPYMEQLAEIASLEENKQFAKLNLMQAYYKLNKYDEALKTSEEVLSFSKLNKTVKWDALKIKARSFLSLKDTLNAAVAYQILEKSPETFIVAEAMYFRANHLYHKEKYELSRNLITNISRISGQSGKWKVKSLLLLAKNYYALDDAFQAIFILESLIENFESYPELVKEAELLKIKYQKTLSEENRSITNDLGNE